jgi:hypothetical protein
MRKGCPFLIPRTSAFSCSSRSQLAVHELVDPAAEHYDPHRIL